MPTALYIFLALVVLVLIVLIANIKVVPQAHAFVVERLGAYRIPGEQACTLKCLFWIR